MKTHRPSADEVLAILVDEHRQASQLDPEVDPSMVLSFDSTIDDWQYACDLLNWKPLGHALNKQWGMSLKDEEWHSILVPARKHTLRELCEVIARHAEIESLEDYPLPRRFLLEDWPLSLWLVPVNGVRNS